MTSVQAEKEGLSSLHASKPLEDVLKLLIVVRLLFFSLVAGVMILAYPVFLFVCDFSSDDRECARSEHAIAVLGATLAFCLPAAVAFVAGWRLSEASIRDISAYQVNALRRFRLAMTIVLVLSLAAILSPLTVGFMALPLLAATLATWVIVESTLVLSRRGVTKTYAEMNDDQLGRAYLLWSARTAESTGWAALQFAAEQVDRIAREADRRSLRRVRSDPDSPVVEPEADSSKSS